MRNYTLVSAVLFCSFIKIGMFSLFEAAIFLWFVVTRHLWFSILWHFVFLSFVNWISFSMKIYYNPATSISCYVCNATDSNSPFQCGEWFERYDTPDIQPQDCSNVYGAKYCVKHIGRFEGKWGVDHSTKLIVSCFQMGSGTNSSLWDCKLKYTFTIHGLVNTTFIHSFPISIFLESFLFCGLGILEFKKKKIFFYSNN